MFDIHKVNREMSVLLTLLKARALSYQMSVLFFLHLTNMCQP